MAIRYYLHRLTLRDLEFSVAWYQLLATHVRNQHIAHTLSSDVV